MEYTHRVASPLGVLLLASDGAALTGLWFEGQKHFASALSPQHEEHDLSVFAQTEQWLSEYFGGRVPDFAPPLHLRGTAFQKAVWAILLTIPFDQTRTYGEIAAQIAAQTGRRCGARAIGGAVGRNPVSLIVPCHRVVGADGGLTGYAGGINRKTWLLQMEQYTLRMSKQRHF